jgi:hypothetical protein
MQSLASAVALDPGVPYAVREAVLVDGMLRSVVDAQVRGRGQSRTHHVWFCKATANAESDEQQLGCEVGSATLCAEMWQCSHSNNAPAVLEQLR